MDMDKAIAHIIKNANKKKGVDLKYSHVEMTLEYLAEYVEGCNKKEQFEKFKNAAKKANESREVREGSL